MNQFTLDVLVFCADGACSHHTAPYLKANLGRELAELVKLVEFGWIMDALGLGFSLAVLRGCGRSWWSASWPWSDVLTLPIDEPRAQNQHFEDDPQDGQLLSDCWNLLKSALLPNSLSRYGDE